MKDNQVVTYPIIVTEEHDAGDYLVAESPNIPGMVTDGKTMPELVAHVQDALATMIEDRPYPKVQDPHDWKLDTNQMVVYVSVDMGKWLHNTRSVKRTISLPGYLDDLARRRNVNVSRIAADALKRELNA